MLNSNISSVSHMMYTFISELQHKYQIPTKYVLIINTILITAIIPHTGIIFEYIFKGFKKIFKRKRYSIKYQDSLQLPREQKILEAVRYYLATHQDTLCTRHLKSKQTAIVSISRENGVELNEEPKMYDIEDREVHIPYKTSERITIRNYCSIRSKSTMDEGLVIYGESIFSIEDFVELCKHEYALYLKDNKSYYNLYRLSQSGTWASCPIKTIKTMKNIYLEEAVKKEIIRIIDGFLKKEDFYRTMGISYKCGFIFHGEVGLGKTSICYAIAYEYKRDIFSVALIDIKPQMMHQIFSQIPDYSVVLFDDIDRSMDESIINNNTAKSDGKLGALLEILDANQYLHGCIVAMTTNNYETIDPAIVRPGRIDHAYKFTYLSLGVLKEILSSFFPDDVEMIKGIKHDICRRKISTSELINTIILPNLDSIEDVMEKLNP